MRLILVRHGNTFEPGSIPYCIGAKEDLPLIEKGRQQGKQFGQALKDAGIKPDAWYQGPLLRHKQFGEIAIEYCGTKTPATIDERLNELDYGDWAGLTDQEIKDKFGPATHEDWSQRSIYPDNVGWYPLLDKMRTDISSFLNDLVKKYKTENTIVAVSSGGRLRFFLEAIPGEFEKRCKSNNVKTSTGNASIFDYADGKWVLGCWNVEPTADLLIRRSNADFIQML